MRYLFLLPLILMGCAPDESISAYVVTGSPYTLTEVNGQTTAITATIEFGEKGKITGQGPCNRYFTLTEDPYPWVKIEGIGATKMACPALADEQIYFSALESMTLAEASGPVLILSNDFHQALTFEQPN